MSTDSGAIALVSHLLLLGAGAICNCSALVDTLFESQLFGHVRGSFTGATDTRPGLFEYANGGTVFLDEMGETSLQMQAKLLRVIQNREIQRVGSPEVRQVSVRLATKKRLRYGRRLTATERLRGKDHRGLKMSEPGSRRSTIGARIATR